LQAKASMHVDLLVTNEDNFGLAEFTNKPLPDGMNWRLEELLTRDDPDDVNNPGGTQTLYRLYLTNTTDDAIELSQSNQVTLNITGSHYADEFLFINSDVFLRPHESNNFDYAADDRIVWLSDDVDGGEMATGLGSMIAPDGQDYDGSGADGPQIVYGTIGHDVLIGSEGNDVLDARAGIDEVQGMGGDDILFGSHHADVLIGGEGNDTIYGEGGSDTISGGEGMDEFVWHADDKGAPGAPAEDRVTDFTMGEDSLNVGDLLQGTSEPLGDLIQSAVDGDTNAATELGNYFSVESAPDGSETILHIDSDGSGAGEGQYDQSITFDGLDTSDMDLVSILNGLVNPPDDTEGGL